MLKHPTTSRAVESFCTNPSHALILLGAPGAGKRSIARDTAATLLQVENLANFPYFLEITQKELTIDAIRKVKLFLAKKTTGQAAIRRVVLINGIDTLNDAGQNALLKSVEEPPQDTVIIMTATDQTLLLPTMMSRSRLLLVLPVEAKAALQHYTASHSEADIRKAYAITKGYAAALDAMLNGHEGQPDLEMAKAILQADKFQRLSMIDSVIKSKLTIADILSAIEIAYHMNFEKSLTSNSTSAAKKFHDARVELHTAQKLLAAKVNTKLVLTRLFLAI